MEMNKLKLKNYNLELTLLGGQAFNWDLIDGVFYGFMQDKLVVIKPARNIKHNSSTTEIHWQTFPLNNDSEFITNYLNLEVDFENILKQIQRDEYIKSAVESVPFTRILKQDFEQTLLSFILSSHKSIKAVRKVVRDISKAYGEKVLIGGKEFYLFPKTEVIASLSEQDLRKIGAGFRARYLKSAAEKLLELRNQRSALAFSQQKSQPISLNNEIEAQTRELLLEFTGIGDKIADCIMTFSLGFITVTPLDIWAKRVLIDLYKLDPKLKYSEMRNWYKNYFGEYTSIAGQFLFEWYRRDYKDLRI